MNLSNQNAGTQEEVTGNKAGQKSTCKANTNAEHNILTGRIIKRPDALYVCECGLPVHANGEFCPQCSFWSLLEHFITKAAGSEKLDPVDS